jgi:hypothetical protein
MAETACERQLVRWWVYCSINQTPLHGNCSRAATGPYPDLNRGILHHRLMMVGIRRVWTGGFCGHHHRFFFFPPPDLELDTGTGAAWPNSLM